MHCAVEIANDGRIGVAMFGQSAPSAYDVILMDAHMPNMNGVEAANAIRAMEREDARRKSVIRTQHKNTGDSCLLSPVFLRKEKRGKVASHI